MYYDKQGKKLRDAIAWAKLFEDINYKIINQQDTDDKRYWVSTIWLGLNHQIICNSKPLIFETMVFNKQKEINDVDIDRYSTLEEAKVGHRKMFNKWNNK